jgi:hypothetical protein
MKIGLCGLHDISPINFWMAEPVFMKLDMYIMALELVSPEYFINPYHQSQSQSYFMTGGLPPISSSWRQAPWDTRLEISFPQLNSCGNSPYVTSSLTWKWVCLLWMYPPIKSVCRPTAVRQRFGKNVTAETNTQQNCLTRRFLCRPYGSKESRRLVLPRTSCSKLEFRNFGLQN